LNILNGTNHYLRH